MAKNNPAHIQKAKDRKPIAGDTVYLRGDAKCVAMYLEKVIRRGIVEYGFCLWSSYHMQDGELVTEDNEKEFLLEELTIVIPVGQG